PHAAVVEGDDVVAEVTVEVAGHALLLRPPAEFVGPPGDIDEAVLLVGERDPDLAAAPVAAPVEGDHVIAAVAVEVAGRADLRVGLTKARRPRGGSEAV